MFRRIKLKSTDTGTERRGYAYGDTGYGIFQKQPFGDTVCIYKINKKYPESKQKKQ